MDPRLDVHERACDLEANRQKELLLKLDRYQQHFSPRAPARPGGWGGAGACNLEQTPQP